MRGRLGVLMGFGAGYVLGAKAGKERYEQLRRLYDNLVASPAFHEASQKAKGAMTTGLGQVREKTTSESTTTISGVPKDSGDEPTSLSVAPPPI